MNKPDAERIEQLKGRINQWANLWSRVYAGEDVDQSNKACLDLFSILDAHSALLAEVEQLRLEAKYLDPEDMPGDLAAKFCPFNDQLHFHHDGCPSEWATEERVRKTEAENERLRKTLEGIREALKHCCAMGKEQMERAEKAEAALAKLEAK